jgi:hypothetical protein
MIEKKNYLNVHGGPAMSEDSEGGDGKEGVIKLALGPAAKDFGREVAPLGKPAGEVTRRAVHLGLKSVSGLVWCFEQVADFVEGSVADKLKDVPPEKITEANPRIAVPAVQALVYSGNDPDIREMFASLIATDLNSDTKEYTHPAFVEIIKQMTAQEGKLLKNLSADGGSAILLQGRIYTEKESPKYGELDLMFTAKPRELDVKQAVKALYGLNRLGLLQIKDSTYPTNPLSKVNEVKETEEYKKMVESFTCHEDVRFREHEVGVWLTPLGEDFVRACL